MNRSIFVCGNSTRKKIEIVLELVCAYVLLLWVKRKKLIELKRMINSTIYYHNRNLIKKHRESVLGVKFSHKGIISETMY